MAKDLNAKISKHAKDIIQKYTSGLFKDATLEFYGVKTARIKEMINVELPTVEVTASSSDIVFLLEDNTYLHFEFQTSYNKNDLIRFAHYDLRLFERDGRNINTVVIYTADVKDAPHELNLGSLAYNPGKVMMGQYDGNAIFEKLTEKINSESPLADVDMLKLIFLPLMKTDIPRGDLAVNTLKLAQTIPEESKRNACIAATFSFAGKYLNEVKISELLEVLQMTDVLDRLFEAYEQKKVDEATKEIAKNLLELKLPIETIIKSTGVDNATIEELQRELMMA